MTGNDWVKPFPDATVDWRERGPWRAVYLNHRWHLHYRPDNARHHYYVASFVHWRDVNSTIARVKRENAI